MKPSVFIGSSSEQLHIAEAVVENLAPVAEISTWKHAFPAGQPYFTRLLELKERFDFAVIILTPDDVVISRDKENPCPRDNLIFELGLFLGSLASDRVFAIISDDHNAKILSDYFGVSILRYDPNRSDRDLTQALSPACVQIKRRIRELGARDQKYFGSGKTFPGDLIGLKSIYESYEAAEQDILRDLKSSPGPVRLFFHIASQNIGIKGSLFDILHDVTRKSDREIRILHSSNNSPLFARDRLVSIGKDPDRVIRSLRYVSDSLHDLERASSSSLRRRQHRYPFIWRLYGFSERLYLMPYFSKKDATRYSPVLLFTKSNQSMFGTFVDWFDHVWNETVPDSMTLEKIVTPATPSGAALFLKWQGKHIFGIPKRDLIEGAEFLRFYGLGGKRDGSHESLEDCALREGAEETGKAAIELVNSPTTDFFKADGTIERINLRGGALIPRLIYEKWNHSGHGSMKIGADYYYMVGFDAVISSQPMPTKEIAALLFLDDSHLEMFSVRSDITLTELKAKGAQVEVQKGLEVPSAKILVPHGTASYLIRMFSR